LLWTKRKALKTCQQRGLQREGQSMCPCGKSRVRCQREASEAGEKENLFLLLPTNGRKKGRRFLSLKNLEEKIGGGGGGLTSLCKESPSHEKKDPLISGFFAKRGRKKREEVPFLFEEGGENSSSICQRRKKKGKKLFPPFIKRKEGGAGHLLFCKPGKKIE